LCVGCNLVIIGPQLVYMAYCKWNFTAFRMRGSLLPVSITCLLLMPFVFNINKSSFWETLFYEFSHFTNTVCLFMVFNATFNNISVISWRSVLLVEVTEGPGEYHRPVASHWQTLSHIVVHLALGLGSIEIEAHNISGDRHWLHR
jgi:hypothetical protein